MIFWLSDRLITFWLQWVPSKVCNWGPRDAILRHQQTGGDLDNDDDDDDKDDDNNDHGDDEDDDDDEYGRDAFG